jgi:hypothetical protein
MKLSRALLLIVFAMASSLVLREAEAATTNDTGAGDNAVITNETLAAETQNIGTSTATSSGALNNSAASSGGMNAADTTGMPNSSGLANRNVSRTATTNLGDLNDASDVFTGSRTGIVTTTEDQVLNEPRPGTNPPPVQNAPPTVTNEASSGSTVTPVSGSTVATGNPNVTIIPETSTPRTTRTASTQNTFEDLDNQGSNRSEVETTANF